MDEDLQIALELAARADAPPWVEHPLRAAWMLHFVGDAFPGARLAAMALQELIGTKP